MRIILLSLFLISSLFAFKYELSSKEIKNGQTALIKFEQKEDIKYKYVTIGEKKYPIFSDYVLIPVSYYAKPKELEVVVHYAQKNEDKTKVIDLQIVDGAYEKETLTVDSSKVKLSKEDKERVSKEYAQAMKIYNTITKKSYIDSKYIMPLDSKLTSTFGRARVFNGSLKSYHSGTDFRAKVGTPIKCVNDGKVVLASDRFYAGGSIIVDHGQGVYTCYYHMSDFSVQEGQKVKKGQIIGLSGKSGRVTGPHLHFSARVGGVQVDPLQFIKLINEEL